MNLVYNHPSKPRHDTFDEVGVLEPSLEGLHGADDDQRATHSAMDGRDPSLDSIIWRRHLLVVFGHLAVDCRLIQLCFLGVLLECVELVLGQRCSGVSR